MIAVTSIINCRNAYILMDSCIVIKIVAQEETRYPMAPVAVQLLLINNISLHLKITDPDLLLGLVQLKDVVDVGLILLSGKTGSSGKMGCVETSRCFFSLFII